MGGVVIIGATLAGYVVAHAVDHARCRRRPRLLVLFLMTGLGLVGFLDDYIKISRQRSLGLRAGAKLAGQTRGRDRLRGARAAVPERRRSGTPASTQISFVRDTGIDLAFAGPPSG